MLQVLPDAIADRLTSADGQLDDCRCGDNLIEAYWKSDAMPGDGIFIGEPLAAALRNRAKGR